MHFPEKPVPQLTSFKKAIMNGSRRAKTSCLISPSARTGNCCLWPDFTIVQQSRVGTLSSGNLEVIDPPSLGKTLWTFTIVTTDANQDFSWLHDRQPVFLTSKETLDRWLDVSPQTWTPELSQMVQPYDNDIVQLEWYVLWSTPNFYAFFVHRSISYQVPKEVGKVGTESPSFIEPITSRKDGIQAMFSKQKQTDSSSSPAKSPLHPGTKRKIEASLVPPQEAEPSSAEVSPSKKLKVTAGTEFKQPESVSSCLPRVVL